MPPVRLNFFVGNALKLFLVAGLLIALFSGISNVSYAQGSSGITKPDAYANSEPDVPHNLQSYYQIAFIEFSSALVCQLTGINPVNTKDPCLGINPVTGKIGLSPTDPKNPGSDGLGSFVSNMIAVLYVPPISTGQQLQYFASNFGIGTAHAQVNTGQGFTGLNAVQGLFIKTRDMVYVLMVVLFVVIGIAIMLRIKIDPRTVMSIQNQIPRIVMGLVLITFSYSIAGFLIDVMWTVTYFSINTMTSGTQLCYDNNEQFKQPLESVATRQILNNPIAYLTDLLGDETGCFGRVDGISGLAIDVGKTFGDLLSRITLAIFGMNTDLDNCNPGFSGRGWRLWGVLDVQDCLKVGMFGFLKYLIALISGIIVFFALIIAMFKIWFTLLKAYISFTLAIVLAPFWIILGLLPGGGLGFGQWIRHLISHLAVFPTTALMLILATIFAANDQTNDPTRSVFLPPLIGNPNIADGIGTIMGFAVILLVPDMLNIIRDALKTPQGKFTGNIMKRAKVSPMSAVGSAGNLGYQASMLRHIPVIGKKIPGLGGGDEGGIIHRYHAPQKAEGEGHPPNSG